MTLVLDPDIRDWVVLPLFVIIVAAGMLRSYLGMYLSVGKKTAPIPKNAKRVQSILQQMTQIKRQPVYLTSTKWLARRQHSVEYLRQEAERLEEIAEQEEEDSPASNDPMEAMMSNPLSMMGGNMVFMVQNMVMMQGIQHFFSGFILLKMPFPLTVGFKNMFQRGIMGGAGLPDLESSYTSSVSWYFLVMYGLRSLFKLLLGNPSQEQKEQDMLLYKLGYQNPPNPTAKTGKQDPESLAKMLRTEADNLELFLQNYKSELDGVEKRLLGSRYPKKKLSTSSKADFLLGGGGKKTSNKANTKKRQ